MEDLEVFSKDVKSKIKSQFDIFYSDGHPELNNQPHWANDLDSFIAFAERKDVKTVYYSETFGEQGTATEEKIAYITIWFYIDQIPHFYVKFTDWGMELINRTLREETETYSQPIAENKDNILSKIYLDKPSEEIVKDALDYMKKRCKTFSELHDWYKRYSLINNFWLEKNVTGVDSSSEMGNKKEARGYDIQKAINDQIRQEEKLKIPELINKLVGWNKNERGDKQITKINIRDFLAENDLKLSDEGVNLLKAKAESERVKKNNQ